MNAIYNAAKNGMGKRLTLDPTVPTSVGCVQAVSVVLKRAGYPIPPKGLSGVNQLIEWLLIHEFREVIIPEPGCIITAHQREYSNPNWAHTGVVVKYGILNNNSITGKFTQSYTLQSWHKYFGGRGSITRYFKPLEK